MKGKARSAWACSSFYRVVGTARLPGNPLPDGWSEAANSAVTMFFILYAATPL